MVNTKIIISLVISIIITFSVGVIEDKILNSAGYVIKGIGCEDNPTKEGITACDSVKSISLEILVIIALLSGASSFIVLFQKLKNG